MTEREDRQMWCAYEKETEMKEGENKNIS